jgi:NHL repeat
MGARNIRTFAILGALLAASAATASSAADDSCPGGEFETDLAAIKHSFVRPDTRLAQTSLASFGQVPAEIARIQSGVIWNPVGGVFGFIANWKAYDADRHLFILVNGGWDGYPKVSECQGYRFKLAAGDRTYCMTIVAGTPEQAREFACRVNRLGIETARAAIEAQRRFEEQRRQIEETARRQREVELARIRAEEEAKANKSGAVPEILVLASRIPIPAGQNEFIDVHCPCTRSSLLKAGAEIPWWSSGGNAVLEGWIDERLALSDRQLWRVLHPPHVIDIAVAKRGDLYLLVDETVQNSFQSFVIKLTPDGRSTAVFPSLAHNASEPLFASHLAIQADRDLLSQYISYQVVHIPGADDRQPFATELTFEADTPIPALDSIGESFESMAPDSDDTLYLALESRILRRAPDGRLTVFAGSETVGHADGVSTEATFSSAIRIATTPEHELVVADTGNNIVRRVSKDGIVTTIAGRAGMPGSSDGSGRNARFKDPKGIAVDDRGVIYVADTGNQTLRRITPDGRVSTLAGRPGSGGTRDGRWNARLDEPSIVAVDSTGTVYVANGVDNNIRRVSPQGVVATLDAQTLVEDASAGDH